MRLALIAHDEQKETLVEFAREHTDTLAVHDLLATGTTGKRLLEATDLEVDRKESGPLGGARRRRQANTPSISRVG